MADSLPKPVMGEGNPSQPKWLSVGRSIPVSEDDLRLISKEIGPNIENALESDSEMTKKQLDGLLNDTLETAGLLNITPNHRTAACNVLCGFLDKGKVSRVHEFRLICFDLRRWEKLFSIYLERSNNAKIKSMRQVLTTLTSLIVDSQNPFSESSIVREDAITRLVRIMIGQELFPRWKAALQALEFFISKEVVSIKELLDIVSARFDDASIYNSERLATNQSKHVESAPHLIESKPNFNLIEIFILHALTWIPHLDVAPAAGHLVSTFFKKLRAQKDSNYYRSDSHLPLWAFPLQESIRKYPESLETFKHHVFPGLFSISGSDYVSFLKYLHLDDFLSGASVEEEDVGASTLFSALEVGKEMGLVSEPGDDIRSKPDALVVPGHVLGQLLDHASPTIRIAALSLLVMSLATTKPFTNETLAVLRRNLMNLHGDTDARFRNEVLSTIKRLFDRARGGAANLKREIDRLSKQQAKKWEEGRETSVARAKALFESHIEFMCWYINCLKFELRSTASYQRHSTALKALLLVVRSGLDSTISKQNLAKLAQGDIKWVFNVEIFDPLLIRALLDLLVDPFEDVRDAAAKLLKLTPLLSLDRPASSSTPESLNFDLWTHLQRNENIFQRTGRADHADGIARTNEVIFEVSRLSSPQGSTASKFSPEVEQVERILAKLEESIAVAKTNVLNAVSESPVHGQLASLRYILDRSDFYSSLNSRSADELQYWKKLHRRMIDACNAIWHFVKGVLCNDSPEGHVPEDAEFDSDMGTKDLLSYSWRALKESSSLLRIIISKATHVPGAAVSMLENKGFEEIGGLSFIQLADLRHRGAFSTVSLTFSACCIRSSKSKEPEVRQLLTIWYKNALFCIRDKASTTTRRSAGIPSLITGILSADLGGELFRQVVKDLQAIGGAAVSTDGEMQEGDLPQVHALNCLKDIFKSAKLGPSSEPYVPETMDLAAASLGSSIWPIRNCGMMLFRAIIDRLFGTSEGWDQIDSEQTSRLSKLSYHSYPNLPRILIKLLEQRSAAQASENSGASVEGVFPALEIIRRAGAPKNEANLIRELIWNHMGSKLWHVREMAAQTYCSLIEAGQHLETIEGLLEKPFEDQNAVHGRLTCVRNIVERQILQFEKGVQVDVRGLSLLLGDFYQAAVLDNICPYSKSPYMDAVNLVAAALARSGNHPRLLENLFRDFPTRPTFQDTLDALLRVRVGGGLRSRHGAIAGPLLRRAAAWSLTIIYYSRGQFSNLKNLLSTLSQEDPDTTCATLTQLRARLPHTEFARELCFIYSDIVASTSSPSVKALALGHCADLLLHQSSSAFSPSSSANPKALNEMTSNSQSITQALSGLVQWTPPIQAASPSLIDAELRLRGILLALQNKDKDVWAGDTNTKVSVLHAMLRLFANERNDFSTRYAGVSSIEGFKPGFRNFDQSPRTSPLLLALYIALYDTLNDDDEEIREKGAEVVAWILNSSSSTSAKPKSTQLQPQAQSLIIPPAASSLLMDFLSTPLSSYAISPLLLAEGMSRVAGQRYFTARSQLSHSSPNIMDPKLNLVRAESSLADALKEDDSLFVEEKQNLYIDEVREAEAWAELLMRLDPTSSSASNSSPENFAYFAKWIVDGLSALTETSKQRGMDGPLGWTAKPDVFTVGMRVICGAKVILSWSAPIQVAKATEMNALVGEVRDAVQLLVETGRKAALHGMWMERLEALL
ncbi:hypothetical protein L228DRAFT_283801 [Xylona heveae TC161]|uniref:Uncharacterized protein n=1 Tax=Xylona heveae (strain CBS 132557 / TC161) TaxID=1328760 RepID=A0A165G2F0_XYLHT|nr:hypothetical protein L228DRAFT_283801 [Xylona heveae TC161]KZF21661.1 hypothetical protein L228DRAFT_283801 [Xylona heveae TC161]